MNSATAESTALPSQSELSGQSVLRAALMISQTSVPGYFPLMTSLSPVSRLGSPPSSHELDAPGIPDHEMGLEDSLRVDYVDPVSVREHRRLLEAVRKGPVSDDVEGPSPVKKVRGRR